MIQYQPTTMPEATTALARVVKEAAIEPTMGAQLVATYTPLYQEAAAAVARFKDLHVTDPTQVDGIADSTEGRKVLKGIRCRCENVRKDLKAGVLKLGSAIDFGSKLLIEQILPIEKQLQDNEDIAIRISNERKAKLGAERRSKMTALGMLNIPSDLEFGQMPEGEFVSRLADATRINADRLAAAARAESERIAREMEEEERQAAQAAENKRLRAEAETATKARKEVEAKAAADRAKALKALREADAIVTAEKARAAQVIQKAAAEAQAIRDAEAAKVKAAADAKAKAERAPDKEKLMALADSLKRMPFPTMTTPESDLVLKTFTQRLWMVVSFLERRIDMM